MTHNKDLKRLIRDRMARTGERYTAARRHVLAAHPTATTSPAARVGGFHDQTAALRDLLNAAGFDAPHTGEPPTEALLLGLGGGLGAAVFSFAYKGTRPTFYLETRCSPQYAYDDAFIKRAAAGFGVELEVVETGGARLAARQLEEALGQGAALAFVDAMALPHHARPGASGSIPWVVVVHEEAEGGELIITDRASAPMALGAAEFAAARGRYRKNKHRLIRVNAHDPSKLVEGVRAGVAYTVRELQGREVRKGYGKNFGLRALEGWADALGSSAKTGWRRRFAPGPDLGGALRQVYHYIVTAGTGGAAFRGLFADFLREGSELTGEPGYKDVAAVYDGLAEQWRGFAGEVLPSRGEAFAAIRDDLHRRAEAVAAGAPTSTHAAIEAALDARIEALEPFPVDAEEVYAAVEAALRLLLEAERAALSQLEALVRV